MKKLAIASAIIALSSSALAASPGYVDNSFYIKAGGGSSWGKELDSTKKTTLGIASKEYGSMEMNGVVGFGYNVMDNVRAEVTFSYINGPKYEALPCTYDSVQQYLEVSMGLGSFDTGKITIESSGFVGFVNGYVDVADLGVVKVYVSGGLGGSYIESTIATDSFTTVLNNRTAEFKKELAFAYNLGAGLSFEASPGMLVDVGYSYTDLGKPSG
jgi:opacity protein-like surface antigen